MSVVPVLAPPFPLVVRNVFASVRFGDHTAIDGSGLTIALPAYGENAFELWRSDDPIQKGSREGIQFSCDANFLLGMLVDDDPDVEGAARRAYQSIVALTRREGYPHLARAWNHVRDINRGEGDQEKYKQFCAGRHDALVSSGFEKRHFPAASTVGMQDGSVAIYFVSSRRPVVNVENPRQVSAYDYPRQYGLRSPSFARATIVDDVVFISGTASVVGHETAHLDDLFSQASETIANLEQILDVCGATRHDVATLKIYVRHAESAAVIGRRFEEAFPASALLVVGADLCRSNLLLEAEAIATRS